MKLKNTIKKVAVAALLAVPLASNVVNTANVHAAAVHVSYPGLTDDTGDSWDMYDVETTDTSWRNFKTRSANIYVKDKSLLPATKKAIKFWSPVFKFKLVKSAKHASFHSKKYANVVIYDENVVSYEGSHTPNDRYAGLTSTRVYENKNKKVIKLLSRRYQAYTLPHIHAKDLPAVKRDPNKIIDTDLRPKDWKKKAFTNHLNMVVETKNRSQQAIINSIICELGQTIGLGNFDNDSINSNDVMGLLSPFRTGNSQEFYNKTYHLTQADKDHIDWIYSHPYTGEVNADHYASALTI